MVFIAACGSDSNESSNGTAANGGGAGDAGAEKITLDMPWGTFELKPEIQEAVASGEPLDIPVFTWVSGDEFFVPVRQGIEDAAKDLGTTSSLIGPVEPDQPKMINDITTYQARNPAGMAIFLADPNAGKATIDRLVDDGIPVVIWNADAPDTKRLAYVGTENKNYGIEVGKLMVAKLKEEGVTSGTVSVFSTDVTAEYAQHRLEGFKETVNAEFPDIKFANPVSLGTDISGAVGKVDAAIKGQDDVIGVYGTDEQVMAASIWQKQNGNPDDMIIVGHNLLPRQLELMAEGYLDGSVGQDPYKQGYMAVEWIHKFVTTGEVICDICDPGFETVDSAEKAREMLETDCDGRGCA